MPCAAHGDGTVGEAADASLFLAAVKPEQISGRRDDGWRIAYLHFCHARRVEAVEWLIEITSRLEHALRITQSDGTVRKAAGAAEASPLPAAVANESRSASAVTMAGVACTRILVTRDVSKLSSG